jgi:hypothetical protein
MPYPSWAIAAGMLVFSAYFFFLDYKGMDPKGLFKTLATEFWSGAATFWGFGFAGLRRVAGAARF